MKIFGRATAVLMLGALTGCAFSAVTRVNPTQYSAQIKKEASYTASVEQATEAAKNAIEAMGWTIQTTNPAMGVVRSLVRPVTVPEVCDCGTWNGKAVAGTADSVIVVNVDTSAEGLSEVKVGVECMVNFRGTNLYGVTTRQEAYACASRGQVENTFWETYERAMKAAAKTHGAAAPAQAAPASSSQPASTKADLGPVPSAKACAAAPGLSGCDRRKAMENQQ